MFFLACFRFENVKIFSRSIQNSQQKGCERKLLKRQMLEITRRRDREEEEHEEEVVFTEKNNDGVGDDDKGGDRL